MKPTAELIIDVREPEEFMAERIPGSINAPLSSWDTCAPALAAWVGSRPVTLTCLSGARARLAAEKWIQWANPEAPSPTVYEKGLVGWKAKGGPVEGSGRSRGLSLFRQVQMIVGPVVLVSSLGALFWDPLAVIPAVVMGLGLSMAGYTGFCGLALLLARAPWNRARPSSSSGPVCEGGLG